MGEVGIVGFGGSAGPVFLHPLERPFTDADGANVFSQVRCGRFLNLRAVRLLGCLCPLACTIVGSEHNCPLVPVQLQFNEDNTIVDRPVVDVLSALDQALSDARARLMSGTHTSLRQLVLIIADGRFHEKESLRRMVRDVTTRSAVLYAFIVVDNPSNSLATTQVTG